MKILKKWNKTKAKRKGSSFVISVIRYLFLISVGYIVLYPIFSAISTAIKQELAYYDVAFYWLPQHVTLENFKIAYDVLDYGKAVFRTITLDVISALVEIVMCAIIAYGFARFEFRGKKFLEFLLMITIVVPVQVYIVSMIVNFKHFDILGILGLVRQWTNIDLRLNLLNTNWTMYLPSLFGMGLRSGILIYIYIQFFKGFPKELEEAAYVDGAGPFKTFWRIVIPSSSVAITTVAVFSMVWHWNDCTLGLMYFTKDYPLAVQLSNLPQTLIATSVFKGGASEVMDNSVIMAGCLLYILPVLIGYLLIQNKFVKSIERVGITG